MVKRKLKKAVCVFAAAVMMLCLSSCMAMETGLIFNEDGTVRLFCDTTIEEDMLSSMEMTTEDFLNSINESESSEEYEDFASETIETEVDGKSYVGQRYYKDMTLDELNAYIESSEDGVTVKYSAVKEGGNLVVTITYTNNAETSEEEQSELTEYMAQGMMTTTQSIIAPYEIVDTNGTVNTETKKITWDTLNVMMGTEKEAVCTVTYKLPATFPIAAVIIIAAVVVVAIVVVVLVMVTKGNKKNEIPYVAPAQEIPAPVQEIPAPVQETEAPAEEEAVTEAPAEEAQEKKFCEICGTKLDADAKFCQGCGEKVE